MIIAVNSIRFEDDCLVSRPSFREVVRFDEAHPTDIDKMRNSSFGRRICNVKIRVKGSTQNHHLPPVARGGDAHELVVERLNLPGKVFRAAQHRARMQICAQFKNAVLKNVIWGNPAKENDASVLKLAGGS